VQTRLYSARGMCRCSPAMPIIRLVLASVLRTPRRLCRRRRRPASGPNAGSSHVAPPSAQVKSYTSRRFWALTVARHRCRPLSYILYGMSLGLVSVSCRRRWPPPTTPNASEVTTLRRYTNLFIIIIIIFLYPR